MQGRVRIIAGCWRRRIIRFDSNLGIRPTTDAARETLFNWLRGSLSQARCLDLYAGSGAIGLEALSRGADQVVFVDSNPGCIRGLRRTVAEFGAEAAIVVHDRAENFLSTTKEQFDVVFVDPPFYRGQVTEVLDLLLTTGCLKAEGLVYVESERSGGEGTFDKSWTIVRSRSSGARSHILLRRTGAC